MRYCSWILNNQKLKNNFKLIMLGCIGDDKYRKKINETLKENDVIPLVQTANGIQTFRCGVGYIKKIDV